MSNVIEFNPRKAEEPESEAIEVDYDPDDIEFIIDVLMEFNETGECNATELRYAFMCMADLVVQVNPGLETFFAEEEPS